MRTTTGLCHRLLEQNPAHEVDDPTDEEGDPDQRRIPGEGVALVAQPLVPAKDFLGHLNSACDRYDRSRAASRACDIWVPRHPGIDR